MTPEQEARLPKYARDELTAERLRNLQLKTQLDAWLYVLLRASEGSYYELTHETMDVGGTYYDPEPRRRINTGRGELRLPVTDMGETLPALYRAMEALDEEQKGA